MKKNKQGTLIKSKKVYLKSKPILNEAEDKNEVWSIFDKILGKGKLRLEEILFSVTKIDEIE